MTENNKTIALVTGANQGIGLAVSKKLSLENGYHVIMTGRREEAVQKAVKQLQDEGLSVEAFALDLGSDESIEAAVEHVRNKFGHLDILVNNAGIASPASMPKNSRLGYETVLGTNVIGTMCVTEGFLPLLAKSQQVKRVVFVSSEMGSLGTFTTPRNPLRMFKVPAYSISKTGLNALCLQYAVEYEDDKSWKFNTCCPGYCATNINGFGGGQSPELGAEIICQLAAQGEDGQTGTFVNSKGPISW